MAIHSSTTVVCNRSESLFRVCIFTDYHAHTLPLLRNYALEESINGDFDFPLDLFGGCHDDEEVLTRNMKHFGSFSLLAGANWRRISKFRTPHGLTGLFHRVPYWQ